MVVRNIERMMKLPGKSRLDLSIFVSTDSVISKFSFVMFFHLYCSASAYLYLRYFGNFEA
jgi:hypothetical protein